jgi:hypothetical protein
LAEEIQVILKGVALGQPRQTSDAGPAVRMKKANQPGMPGKADSAMAAA